MKESNEPELNPENISVSLSGHIANGSKMKEPKKIKKRKVLNKWYAGFLYDGSFLKPLTNNDLSRMLRYINDLSLMPGRKFYYGSPEETRALLIFLYVTGARPIEATLMKQEYFQKNKDYVTIYIPTKKKGRARQIVMPSNNHLIGELFKYASSFPLPEMFIFYNYREPYIQNLQEVTTKGVAPIYRHDIRINRMFTKISACIVEGGLPPYYLRHNRFTAMAMNGASSETIMYAKGSRRLDSVFPYLHMQRKRAEEIGELMLKQ
jgi:integrase